MVQHVRERTKSGLRKGRCGDHHVLLLRPPGWGSRGWHAGRAPPHTIADVGLIGGGQETRLVEVLRAHHAMRFKVKVDWVGGHEVVYFTLKGVVEEDGHGVGT